MQMVKVMLRWASVCIEATRKIWLHCIGNNSQAMFLTQDTDGMTWVSHVRYNGLTVVPNPAWVNNTRSGHFIEDATEF